MTKRVIWLLLVATALMLLAESAAAQRGGHDLIFEELEEPELPLDEVAVRKYYKQAWPVSDPPTWNELAPFRNVGEFNDYRLKARDAARQRGMWWASKLEPYHELPLLAQAEMPCDPSIEECGSDELEEVLTTGMRASNGGSITNNQESGVDEGDIVKAWGRFMVVLYHGRLFSIDTGEKSGELKLIDRVNAYQSAETDTWIDELLLNDNQILVTGYSYEEDASNLSLFTINRNGVFELVARYFIESSDYYSWENYATRLVDGHLVIYTPFELPRYSGDVDLPLPRMRQWTPRGGYSPWRPLFRITDLYRPVQPAVHPSVHVISVCPIQAGAAFTCASRGIIGPAEKEMYVSPKYAYLWLSNDEYDLRYRVARRGVTSRCAQNADPAAQRWARAALYRLDLVSGEARAVHTLGSPSDQFVFDERREEFLALVNQLPRDCWGGEVLATTLAHIPNQLFSRTPPVLPQLAYQTTPNKGRQDLQTRYAEHYLLYGSPMHYWAMPEPGDKLDAEEVGILQSRMKLAVVPLDGTTPPRELPLGQTIDRIELFGSNALVFGSTLARELSVSSLDLRSGVRVADSLRLAGVRESEGRSHSFNGMPGEDGSGLFGLPTNDIDPDDSDDYREITDVQFFSADTGLNLQSASKLAGHAEDEEVDGGYECEVSCEDWYGNARPIFYRDRIFALTGQELIEGALVNGRIAELARVNITHPPAHVRGTGLQADSGPP
jgi:hypothetical protein